MTSVIIIIVCLIIAAIFSACETSLSSVNKIRLKNYALKGNKKAERALSLATNFDDAITTVLICNNVVNIASTSVCTIFFNDILGSKSIGLATAVMTVLVIVFGEILPKSFAKENAESCALFFAYPLSFVIIILKPVIWILKKFKDFTMKFLKSNGEQPSVTEDELKYIIDEIEEQGVLEEQEGDLVRSALEFDETTVDEILIPRVNVVGIEINTPIDKIKNVFIEEMYSRLPVYEKSLDNILGIITQKEFFRMITAGKDNIRGIMQDAVHISELQLISETLRDMQKSKTHMAIVMDQYGGTKGILTMEDIIEELVGEIYDENDEVISAIVKIGEDEYEISGELNIDDMLEELELPENIIETTANSVGGWIMELLGHIPKETEAIETGIFKIRVLKLDEQKIEKIHLTIIEQ